MSFDTLAPWYAPLERLRFGNSLQQARCAFLSDWPHDPPDRVLTLGEGDGRFLEQALVTWPHAEFAYVDASQGMLKLAKKRCGEARVQHVCQDIKAFLAESQQKRFDLITTHFFLDCFSDSMLGQIIPQIATLLAPKGTWIVTDFTDARFRHRLHLAIMYRFFRLTTEISTARLPRIEETLQAGGLTQCERRMIGNGFVFAECWKKL